MCGSTMPGKTIFLALSLRCHWTISNGNSVPITIKKTSEVRWVQELPVLCKELLDLPSPLLPPIGNDQAPVLSCAWFLHVLSDAPPQPYGNAGKEAGAVCWYIGKGQAPVQSPVRLLLLMLSATIRCWERRPRSWCYVLGRGRMRC
eukprot:1159699-Pelagomonas_calceolata.AAC.16